MASQQWSDLPHGLLSQIADDLGIIELLSFRGVCKDWHSASSSASAIESLQSEPWLLMHGEEEGSQCSLLSNQGKKYSINIPEMDGATCLASYGGWLLLFREASIFFFCPFSRARIDLPTCPFSILSDHVAAFSSAPTSPDCMVAVIRRIDLNELGLFLLCRGSAQWKEHRFDIINNLFSSVKGATYQGGAFHFLDKWNGLVTFDAKTEEWTKYTLVVPSRNSNVGQKLNYARCLSRLETEDMKGKLALEDNVSISTCSTYIPRTDTFEYDLLIQSENIEAAQGCETRHLKGIWIQPRYFQISPDHESW